MICDHINNSSIYEALHPAFQRAFEYLKTVRVDNLPVGRLELDGDRVFAFSSSYETLPVDQRKIESHRDYLDIQYVVSGTEAIGYARVKDLEVSEPYTPDVEFYNTTEDTLIPAKAGTFMIFYPDDAHRPGCIWKTPSQVTKVVVKIAL